MKKRSRPKVLRRPPQRRTSHPMRLEKLEERQLLATFTLAGVQPNTGEVLIRPESLSDVVVDAQGDVTVKVGSTLSVSPRELTFRFDETARINPGTVGAIHITGAGRDGVFDSGDDVIVSPGFIGVRTATGELVEAGQAPLTVMRNEVVYRFAETLPDDLYRIEIFAQPDATAVPPVVTPLRGTNPDPGAPPDTLAPSLAGLNREILVFDLDTGPQILAVVPQPVRRDASGNLQQMRNQVEVYFSEDDLFVENDASGNPTVRSAEHPDFYQLILTRETIDNTDDSVFKPDRVDYDPETDRAILTFSADLHNLGPAPGGAERRTYRLRIGTRENLPLPPVPYTPGAEPGDSFATADAVDMSVAPGQSSQSLIITSAIEPQQFLLDFLGSEDEPGHRDIPDHVGGGFSQHINGAFGNNGADNSDGITTIFYNFRDDYAPGRQNLITEQQKVRSREAFELWGNYLGVQFLETPDLGLTIVLGDPNALPPSGPDILNHANGFNFITRVDPDFEDGMLILSNAFQWNDSFGADYFQRMMIGIGAMLGLGRADDLPISTLMAFNSNFVYPGAPVPEPIFPGNYDILHGQHLHRTDSNDIDLYRFTVDLGDELLEEKRVALFTAETFAERLPNSSLLDTVLRIYEEVDGVASVATSFNTAGAVAVEFTAREAGPSGDDISITVSKNLGVSAPPTVSVSGNTINLVFNTGGGRTTTAQEVVDAINGSAQASALVEATIASGSPNTNVSAPAINYSPLDLRGGVVRRQIARNDNYYSEDSYLELELGSGVYYIGVSASGNEQYDPTIENTGLGGASQGEYDLRLTLRPQVDENDIIRDVDRSFTVDPFNTVNPDDPPETPPFQDLPGTRLDGDADGVPGGVHNYWFQTQQLSANPLTPRTLFVDKTPKAGPRDGSLARPYQTIPEAFLNAKPGDIVRIVGNGGADGLLHTEADNFAYEIGFDNSGQPLQDGSTMAVPKGVTVMVDQAAVFKMRRSRIGVGSSSLTVDRSGGALQVLGVPRLISDTVNPSTGELVPGQLIVTGSAIEPGSVFFTSWLDESIGRDNFAPTTTPSAGDWGGIVIRADIDNAEARFNLEREGVFLNIVNQADIRYGGGGNVIIDGNQQIVNPIQINEMRPTISYNSITRSADAAMAADPNSFAETNFHAPQQQLGASFTSDYERIGPDIHGNRLVNNSINGLFVKINTPAGSALPPLQVPGRFDDINVVHYIAENLNILSTPGGPTLEVGRPTASLVTLEGQPGGSLAAGTYNYKVVFVDRNGFEGRPSEATENETILGAGGGEGAIQLSNLPSVSGNFVSRRIYRSQPDGQGPYHLAGELNATQSTFLDTGARTGPVLERDVPSTSDVTLTPQIGGQLVEGGTYDYLITFVNSSGEEGPASDPTDEVTLAVDVDPLLSERTIRLDNLPDVPEGSTMRIYRSQPDGEGPYELATPDLPAGTASFVDNGAFTGEALNPLLLGVVRPRLNARLRIDPSLVVKLEGARIEARFGSQIIAEGLVGQEVVMTSKLDDRYGAGGTFDTNNDNGPNESAPRPGDWGGLYFGHGSTGDIDHAVIAHGGGVTRVEGTFRAFNVIEIHQGDLRLANSIIENNADGVSGQGPTDRFGRGFNLPATIFVRGAQPIIVDNIIRNGFGFQRSGAAPTNEQVAITINVNSLGPELQPDRGRSTGSLDRITRYDDNQGPLVRGNRLGNNGVNGMVVRGDVLTTEGVWDDTDIVHVLTGQFDNARDNVGPTFGPQFDLGGVRRRYDEVIVPDFHTLGGLRLESSPTESLVVKFWGEGDSFNKVNGLEEPNPRELFGAGITATGRPLEIRDRIGGVIHVLGRPGFPVVMTSLRDDTVGAGVKPDGSAQTDTNNDGFNTAPKPNDWRGIVLDQYSYDRNVEVILEQEPSNATAPGANATIDSGQDIGDIAPHEFAGDENQRLGFVIHGFLNTPADVDVYTFTAEGGTEVWLDIDRSTFALDAVVEVLDGNGNLLAQSDNSADETQDPSLLFNSPAIPDEHVNELQKRPDIYQPRHQAGAPKDFYSVNPRDPGMRIRLPGSPGSRSPYHIRVRSSNLLSSDLPTDPALQDPARLTRGLTSGVYQLQVRMRELDEFAGSTIRYSDIRYAMNGVEAYGLPGHSPLVGEFGEDESAANEPREAREFFSGPDESNDFFTPNPNAPGQRPQELGNLFELDQSVMSIAGQLANSTDVDFYAFDIDYTLTAGQFFESFTTLVFDMDYADGLARPDTNLAVFNTSGRLLLSGLDSNISDDQPGPLQGQDMDDFSRGSAGARDPFIGAALFPEGRYIVAVTSEALEPTAFLHPLARREPINTVRRIAEDHISSSFFSTAEPPVVADLFDEGTPMAPNPAIAPWRPTDVRGSDPGHGVNATFDGSRSAQPGGTSLFTNQPGTLTSNTFDLSGYSAEDLPVLYFTYHLCLGAAGDLEVRVNGQLVATSDPSVFNTNPNIFPLEDDGFWRQARIPLGQFAGQSDLALEFEVTGTLGPGDEGAFIDDVIIGFAERGEMVTGDFTSSNFENEPNDTFFSRQSVEPAAWSTNFSPNIGDQNINTSTTIPHATILGTGNDSFDYYSFTVGVAGSRGIFEIDFSNGFNPQLFLFDSAGNELAMNDDSPNTFGAGGSFGAMGLDPYIEFVFAAPGTYVIAVAESPSTSGPTGTISGNPVPSCASYTLQLSVTDHALNSPSLFTPTGVPAAVPSGAYQLEIRVASEFGETTAFPNSTLTRTIDTNDRLTEEATLVAPAGSDLQDGDTLRLSDGVDFVTLEFNSVGGVAGGNLAVPFSPMDPDYVIARRIRDAVNSPSAQTRFSLLAANADGTVSGSASRDNRVNLFGNAVVDFNLAGNPTANDDFVIHHTGFGDENHQRHQGQLLIHSNTITDARDFGIVVDAGERDHEPGFEVGLLRSHPGAVRNLRELNNQPVGGFAPGAYIANNVIAGEGLGGIHASGDVQTWELTTFRPADFPIQTTPELTAGDQVCDAWTFTVEAYRQVVTFEWEDISGDLPQQCGSGVAGGNGFADGNIPVYYRRTSPQPYNTTRTLGYSQLEMANAIRASIASSHLVTNGTSLVVEAIREESRSIGDGGVGDWAVYLENVDEVIVPGGQPSMRTRMVQMGHAPQPFHRIVNNTIFGNDGRDAFSPGEATDEPNDILSDAVDTKQGRQHYPLSYVAQGEIGDGVSFPADLSRDVDFYRFHLEVGERVTIDIDADVNGSGLDPFLRLFDSQGRELAVSDNDPAPGETADNDSFIEFVATRPGTYYVGVSGAGNEGYDAQALGNRATPPTSGPYTIDLNVHAPRTFVISAVSASQIGDGTTFEIEDVTGNVVTFEFDTGGGVAGGNFAIPINANFRAPDVARAIADRINAAALFNRYTPALPNLIGEPPLNTSIIDTRTVNPVVPSANPLERVSAVALGGRDGAEKAANTVHRRPIVAPPLTSTNTDFTNGGELGFAHNSRVTSGSGTTELHVVIENASRISSPTGVMRTLITPSPNGNSNADQILPETGVLVSENATPTLLNNLLINNQMGLMDETPVTTTVIGASMFQNNDGQGGGRLSYRNSGDSNVGNVNDDFNQLLPSGQRIFVDAADNVFTPSLPSPVIDTAVDTLLERDQFASVKGAVGIPPSRIKAPDRDVNGLFRVDHPDAANPSGQGGNVFGDRGAVELADFVGPAADLIVPQDNDPEGRDIDRARSVVQVTSGSFSKFEIQLTDAFEAADPFPGIGVDDDTVTHTVIENGLEIHPAVTVFENGRPLREKIDYSFDYNTTSNILTLTPLAGLWLPDRVYVIRLNNEDRFVVTIPSGDAFADGDQITVTDAEGASVVFELEGGFTIQLPEPLHIQTPTPAASLDGRTFSINSLTDGSLLARFEFDTNGVVQDADGDGFPDNIVINVNTATDTRDTLADKIVTALQSAGIGLAPQKSAGGDVFVGLPFDQSLTSNILNFSRGQHPIVGDGETFTIGGVPGGPFTFEFDTDGMLTDDDGDGVADNLPIVLDGADTRDDVADKIVAALNAAGLNLDPNPADTFAVPANVGGGRVQIGGLPGATLDASQSPSLMVRGAPGVQPSTTLTLPGPLAIVAPGGGGAALIDGDSFVVTVGGQPTTFEFDSDGMSTGVAVPFTPTDTRNVIADAMVTAISSALPALSPVNQGAGVVELGAPRGTTLDLTLAPALSQQGGFVADQDLITISDGVNPPVTFEFDADGQFIDQNGDQVPDNRLIDISSATSNNQIVNAIINAINTAIGDGALVGLSPMNLGGGVLRLNDTNRHITTLSPGSTLTKSGVPGGAVPVPFVGSPDFGPEEMFRELNLAVQAAVAQGMIQGVEMSERFNSTYFIDGVLGVSGLENFFLPAIADEAGNPLKANRATDETLFTILLPGVQLDFGDAPQNGAEFRYPTLFAGDGARHVITDDPLFLGSRIDSDPDGRPIVAAGRTGGGDDNEFVIDTQTSGLTATMVNGVGWSLQIPAGFDVGTADGRTFRISESGTHFTFELNNNNVFVDADMDLAPDNILVDIQGLTTVDEIADAIAQTIAGVSELDLPAFHQGGGEIILPADDEDGVQFVGSLNAFISTEVRVTVSKAGFLDAWIDFNADGDWDDPQEKIFNSVPVQAGVNVLTINTPPSAVAPEDIITYARFRVSTAGNLNPGGLALDGEVEDYQVTIVQGTPATAGDDPDPMLHDPAQFMTNEDVILNSTADLFVNDSDPDFDDDGDDPDGDGFPFTLYDPETNMPVTSWQTTSANGALVTIMVDANNVATFTYDPTGAAAIQALDVDETLADTFTYTISDGEFFNTPQSVGTVTVTVSGANDAPTPGNDPDPVLHDPADFTVGEDAVLSPNPDANLFVNDTDPEGHPLTFVGADTVSAFGAMVTVNPDGTFSYDGSASPQIQALGDGDVLEDTFTYTVSDGEFETVATVTITVVGSNDPPMIVGDSFTTDEDTALPPDAARNVLANDSDPEGSLSVVPDSFTTNLGAEVVLNADGTFSYDPTGSAMLQALGAGEMATDTFSYTAVDSDMTTGSAMVTITVTGLNDPPEANDDPSSPSANFTTSEDVALARNFAASLFANDSDPEGDPISLDSFQATSDMGAAVVVFNDGTFTYDPRSAPQLQALLSGQSAMDTFTYTITDGQGGFDTATVTITVNGANDVPVAVDDPDTTDPFPQEFSTDEDTVLTLADAFVLANDFDPDGSAALEIASVASTTAAGASITFDAQSNTFTYDPRNAAQLQALAPGESLDDTFTYTVTDGNDTSLPATVTIRVFGVNDAPTANPNTATTDSGILVRIMVLANDTDVDSQIDPSSVQIVTPPGNGNATVNPVDGSISYRSDADFVGNDVLTYRVADVNGDFSAPATVTITVNTRENPWQNPVDPLDVNADGLITILDALIVVNTIRDFGNPVNLETVENGPPPNRPPFVDPTGDEVVSVSDILPIIAVLRARIESGQTEPEGESESFDAPQSLLAGNVIDAAPDDAFPGYRTLTDIDSASYFRRQEGRDRDAALADYAGDALLDAWEDAGIVHASSDEDRSLFGGEEEDGDDATDLAALDALFGEGFEV